MSRRTYWVAEESPHRQLAYPRLALGQEWYVTVPPCPGTVFYAPSPPIGITDGMFYPNNWTFTNPIFFSQISAVWQGPMVPDSYWFGKEWFTFLIFNREYYYTPDLEPYVVLLLNIYCLDLPDLRLAGRTWAASWRISEFPITLEWEFVEPVSGLSGTANINNFLDP